MITLYIGVSAYEFGGDTNVQILEATNEEHKSEWDNFEKIMLDVLHTVTLEKNNERLNFKSVIEKGWNVTLVKECWENMLIS